MQNLPSQIFCISCFVLKHSILAENSSFLTSEMSSIADNYDDDRISNLPETLICHILSFLPTKQAVATSVLAKRWIHLWCSVLAINFSNTELYDLEACFRFSESVYSVLLSHNSIKSFCLGITYGEEGLMMRFPPFII